MLETLKQTLTLRPWWMNGILLFCAYMTFIYLPWDIFIKPVSEDQEVWFGLLFTGWAAKLGALLHWFVYAAGTLGFWKMKSWIHPWAAVYVFQIALGMLIWSSTDERGSGLISGLLVALTFVALAIALLKAKDKFNGDSTNSTEAVTPQIDE